MVIAKSKKVKPIMNNTIKKMDYNWTPGPDPPNNLDVGVPRAVFTPHSNSLPFDERVVTLEQPVKIGRNVYRATPSPTNTIFECRVLSRHHATLYYEKDHFYLVDNHSSNGTFVNNNRCSISKEREPHEVFSGDVVQFGISVVENAVGSTEKTTFPPVVAVLKLYHPDGEEAKLPYSMNMTTTLPLKELYQLNTFVQEAIQREALLESRLRTLRECVERTRAEAQASWELFVGEQKLLLRVHTLESMLSVGKQPDANNVAQLLHDKSNYQKVAQESLKAAHEQRIALEETLEQRTREAAALHQHNCALRLAAYNALEELQKLAVRSERRMSAARLAIAAAEERERVVRNNLPLAFAVQNGEAKMLVVSTDNLKQQAAKRGGSLEDAVRALPDYVKLLLPQNLLNKVGIKLVTAEGMHEKLFNLILKRNNIYNSDEKDCNDVDGLGVEKQQTEEGDEVGGSGEEKSGEPDSCTDDEKQSRLNHEPGHEGSLSPLDGELRADNNANSTYNESDNREDSPNKGGVEYANILRIMGGLNEEIKVLRERLVAAGRDLEQLRGARDQLLAADDAPDARITDLQAQLSVSTTAVEANLAEIQRLATNTAELEAELAARPTRADLDDLNAIVADLRAEIRAKDKLIESRTPAPTADKAVGTDDNADTVDPKQISAEIDEMFRLDYEDDESDSAVTEITAERDTCGSFVRLDDSERLQLTMQNGSLHALEEELVRAKERWAEVSAEKARLAAELAAARRPVPVLALILPLVAAALYYLLLPYLS